MRVWNRVRNGLHWQVGSDRRRLFIFEIQEPRVRGSDVVFGSNIMIRKFGFTEHNISRNKNLAGLQIIKAPTLLILGIANENAFTTSTGKFIPIMKLIVCVAKASKRTHMIKTWDFIMKNLIRTLPM